MVNRGTLIKHHSSGRSPLHDAGAFFWVIVGSGPGANHPADVDLVKRFRPKVLTINNMHRYFPTDCVYSYDSWWWDHHIDEVRDLGVPLICGDSNTSRKHGCHQITARHRAGLSRDTTYVTHGNNSGHQAINLLHNAGVKDIALLGFVMQEVNGERRCHEPHKAEPSPPDYASWRLNLSRMARDLDKAGTEVANCSRNSAVDCFETMPLWVWLNRMERKYAIR